MPGSFTYDGDPSVSTLARVRFLLQDTTAPGSMTDEEITYLLTVWTTPERAALAAARVLFSRFSQATDKSVGDLRISFSSRATQWADAIKALEVLVATTAPAGIYAGGLSIAEQETDDADTDLPTSRFRLGMHSYPDSPDAEEIARLEA